MSDFLMESVGLEFHPRVEPKERILRFFERYLMGASVDHSYNVREIPGSRGHLFVCTLKTPSLFNWSFEGPAQCTRRAAENAACWKFLGDEEVVEIMKWLPPPGHKMKTCLDHQLPNWRRKELRVRGINVELVLHEAKQDFYSRFQDMGCRCALWDGNA
eukprot:Skav205187  [mRNA]  locus=scaffold300:77755:78231:- [translate_table: standard]